MEGILFLLVFVLFVWVFLLQDKVSYLSQEVSALKTIQSKPANAPATVVAPAATKPAETPAPATVTTVAAAAVTPQPITTAVTPEPKPEPAAEVTPEPAPQKEMPQTVSAYATAVQKEEPKEPKAPISFVQLFAWIGGFIFLLGVSFWIKYALENDLISPALRIVFGTLVGIGLWVAGALITKPKLKITADTLCAVGLSTCYFVWFCAYYFYQMTGRPVAFALLVLVSVASFATAVWKNSQYIGVLAQITGFLTPYLFRTDHPQIWFFLIYISLINIAAIAAALKRNWTHQLFTGLIFTLICFLAVTDKSSAAQIICFSGIFSLLYTGLSVKHNNQPLLYFTLVFSLFGFCALCGQDLPVSDGTLPYVASFAGFFTLFYGILAARQKNDGLIYSSLGLALVFFIVIATSGKIAYTLGFAAGFTLFFGFVTARFKGFAPKLLAVLLSLVGAISVTVTAKTPIPGLLFLLGATAFFGYFTVKEKDENLFVSVAYYGIIPLLILLAAGRSQFFVWMVLGSILWGLAVVLTPFILKNDFLSSKKVWLSACGCGLFSGTIACIIFQANVAHTGGLMPLLFAGAYGVLFDQVFRWQPVTEPVQRFRTTGVSVVALTFLTWAIGEQFSNEWLTITLALEGAALIWLWHKFRLAILQTVGTILLTVTAMRLLLNPSIEEYYAQTQLIFNWYLYTYLLCAAATFAGAFYWRKTSNNSAAKFLRVTGGLLLFALVNIEIANFFADGWGLSFDFCGELASAATYTIAWTICGAVCLFCAVRKYSWLRKCGIVLIGLAVLKLFLSDIWHLSTALRVFVTIGVAVIMILVSFIYQQFSSQPKETK